MRHNSPILFTLLVMIIASLSGGLTGCSGSQAAVGGHDLPMASMEQMPLSVQQAPHVVQEAYQFALANPDTLKQLPCYCGCGSMGHTSNYACYVQGAGAGEEITIDEHALGCSICVDITQDAMRLLDEGKSLQEIRSYVDETYAQYGPSNIPGN